MLDENGLIRSDGRLAHAEYLSFDVRYPVILPLETRPVNFELESVNGNVKLKVSAFTDNRVTGAMTVVD